MDHKFWLERWQGNQIGFHEGKVNDYLRHYLAELNLAEGSRIFVPLCGKSVDMKWLGEQGYSVLGVELSEIASLAFFKENGYAAQISTTAKFKQYTAENIRIMCGDFFELGELDMAGVRAVYDRASMVALPLELRERYVQHLVRILATQTKMLLVTFEYPQAEMSGPPFAISAAEVERLYHPYAEIKLLLQIDILSQNPRFKEKGLTSLRESVYMLKLH